MQYHRLAVVPCCLGSITAVIAGEFEDKLKAAGISPEVIDILVKQEFTAVGDLGSLTVESLVGMGIKHGTAQKIVANFGKKVRSETYGNGLQLLAMDKLTHYRQCAQQLIEEYADYLTLRTGPLAGRF